MSRQARKEAAAATQDLLNRDASRVRKAGAEGAAAAMRKTAAAPVPKDVAPTPPRSFTDGSYYFNGSSGDFFSSPGPSSQPWSHQSADPAVWGTNATPPGGFTNFIQPHMSQNFTFGGESSHANTMKCLKKKLFPDN